MAVVARHGRTRRSDYLPLVVASLSLLLLLAALPSALNLPQTNPAETLEYAPVPPDDESPPSQEGNFSSLGLGSSGSLGAAEAGPGDLPPVGGASLVGAGKNPSTKRCVGRPPRQTEDPMAPPCVAYFNGDNGGRTARGVTRDEVLILVYLEALDVSAGVACHEEGCDYDEYYDLGKPETESNAGGHSETDAYWPHVWRVWQRYFNERYQTYGRFVHIWVHWGSSDNSPEARRSDVADAAGKLDPFAVIADVAVNGEAYVREWARRGKAVFMTKTQDVDEVGFNAELLAKFPGRLWSFAPSLQNLADSYSSFLCAQVVGHPVSFAGDGTNGQPRKLGLLLSRDPNTQNWVDYGKRVKERLEACGATIVSEQIYDCDRDCGTSGSNADTVATVMRQDGVTTIIYLTKGPSTLGFSHAVKRQTPPWRPEWLVNMDNTVAIQVWEDPEVYRHARNFTIWPRAARAADRPCEQAFLEVEPEESGYAGAWPVCYSYNDARMLFIGIQVAGPRLTGESLDVGMHAIPEIPSGDVRIPACFYETGDYTCVKDAQVQWWDPASPIDRATQPGCWTSIDGGKRYLPGSWPERDIEAARRPTDTCNVQGTGSLS